MGMADRSSTTINNDLNADNDEIMDEGEESDLNDEDETYNGSEILNKEGDNNGNMETCFWEE
jgi:hypothetical protein